MYSYNYNITKLVPTISNYSLAQPTK